MFLLGIASLLPPPATGADGAPSGFVRAQGAGLVVDGRPWRAVGANLWDMDVRKALAGDLTGCYYQRDDLDAYFEASFRRISEDLHATVVRTFGFMAQYTAGGRDWASTDKLLYYAQKHNIRVIPVFGDQWGACASGYKTPDWYHCPAVMPAGCTPGYKRSTVWGSSYRSYVVEAVRRYKDNPTIAFWQLMNEAFVAAVNGQFDTTALPDFSRDMVSAIRQEAGDQNHLVNLGTIGVWRAAGSQLPYYGLLLDCPADGSGGCTDLAEVHDYSGRPLHGIPLGSAVTAELVLWNDRDEPFVSARVSPSIDGWTVITGGSPGPRYRRWGLRLTAASGSAWSAYVDDAIVQTSLGPQVYSFETGTEGFTATGASVGQSSRQPKTGLASLRADVPASLAGQAQIQAPPIAAPASSISVAVRLTFAAPTAESAGLTMAPYFHEAVVSRGKPFFVGEAGIAANVIGASARGQAPKFGADGCVGRPSVIERALAFDAMMALQMDDEHGSSGLIAWDWKDPTLPVTRWDGAQIVDPTFNCYSIAPEDPAVSVFARWADQTPNDPPLPPPSPLPAYGPAFVVLQAPPAEVVNGSKVPLAARMTVGGDPLPGIRILSTGGCGGWGTTNALGFVKFSCMVSTSGTITITVAPDPASCGCTTPGTTYTVTSRDA